jgi:hypothetical protein
VVVVVAAMAVGIHRAVAEVAHRANGPTLRSSCLQSLGFINGGRKKKGLRIPRQQIQFEGSKPEQTRSEDLPS